MDYKFIYENFFGVIITYLSITIGFAITAMSIIAASPISNALYKIEYKQSKTVLDELIDRFKSYAILNVFFDDFYNNFILFLYF